MSYYVTQYGKIFFVIRKVYGYASQFLFNGTQINEDEYKKLYYSNDQREKRSSIHSRTGNFEEIKIPGDASVLLDRPVRTFCGGVSA